MRFFKSLEGQLVILPVLPIRALNGMLASTRDRAATLNEMEDAIAEGATDSGV